ncbi:MAG: magnesium chelatase subunit H [Chloroflexi bacterium]|nr:magnesium chelatase subunit H [Chloroflexota bacterium]
MMKLCFVAVGVSSLVELDRIARRWESGPWAGRLEVATHYVGGDDFGEDQWPAAFRSMFDSDLTLLDTMGVPAGFSQVLLSDLDDYPGHLVVANADKMSLRSLTRLGKFSMRAMGRMGSKGDAGASGGQPPDMSKMMKMIDIAEKVGRALPVGPLRDMRNTLWITQYWLHGGEQNIENMLFLLGRDYFGFKDFPRPQPPQTIADTSLNEPVTGHVFPDRRAYERAFPPDANKPTIGVLFRARGYPIDTRVPTVRLVERLRQSFNVVPVALDSALDRDFSHLRVLLGEIDVLLNLQPFRLGQGPMGGAADAGEAFLRALNVPYLHPFLMTKRTIDEWQADPLGAGTGTFLISMFLPELDGAIETIPLGAVDPAPAALPDLVPIEERIDTLAQRALNWSALRHMPNHDKRLALVLYNYPPGEGTVGGAAFLDTLESVAAILRQLAATGYDVTPMTAADLRRVFVASGNLNTPRWNQAGVREPITVKRAQYAAFTADLPGAATIEARWGTFPGSVMIQGESVVLPGIVNGKVFIGLQPARGVPGNVAGSYHDKHLPPRHQYAAFYRWLEREFGAAACVHVGTHGTLEFLPGKEKATSGGCFTDSLTGTMPHLYLYYSGNPAEGMIAKRRSRATTISYQPPPFVQGDLYDDLAQISKLIDEHAEASHLHPERCPAIEGDIRERVEALGWPWDGLDALHRKLHEIGSALIPRRLHTLGQPYTPEEIAGFLAQLFRRESGDHPSLYALLCADHGWDWDAISAAPHQHTEQVAALEAAACDWIEMHVLAGEPVKDDARRAIQHAGQAIQASLASNGEIDALLRGLDGEYIPPGLGGDIFRSPELLPSGRNLVQFDPRRVPSPSALRSGAQIAHNTLSTYYAAHGVYPRSTAVILWGLETSKTQGETVGQILAYLGVRVTRGAGGAWEPQIELIPLDELGRPRVDVTVQMCGFFRDMFPNVLELLQQAFELVGFQPEDDAQNYVKANARTLFDDLRADGLDEVEAREFALARLFGPAPSNYGTSVEALVENRAWTNEADLVAAYVDSLQHAYTPGHHGKPMPELLQQNLSRVDVVSQVRGSRDYEMTDLDHYYEFFGGLARSVEQASGKRAMMLVSDTHAGHVHTEDIKQAVDRGVWSRLLNPKWLDGMLSHDYHGGQQLAKRLENLMGLAATTHAVDHAIFDQVNTRLIFDDDLRARIQANNPYALMDLIERLWEAHQRGYWQPDDATLDRFKDIYMQLENHLEGLS